MVDYNAIHKPVLLRQCVDLITPALTPPAGSAHHGTLTNSSTVVDCTLGLAGHAEAILEAAPQAHLIGIDRDSEALALAGRRLHEAGVADRFTPVHATFDTFSSILDGLGVDTVDAVLMDLGLSSLQIDERDRGFSYSHDGPLDMRMDPEQELTASRILATYSQEELIRVFREYGEERFAVRIARQIARQRVTDPITTSGELNELVARVVPQSHRAPGNPAKRVFQALRIEVNGELDALRRTLPQIAAHLAVGGRLIVESYHSLEDRIVKSFMREGIVIDVPAGLPAIPDEAQPYFRSLTNGAIKADAEQVAYNPRSSSVRLRAVELIRGIPVSRMRRLQTEALARERTSDRQLHRRGDES